MGRPQVNSLRSGHRKAIGLAVGPVVPGKHDSPIRPAATRYLHTDEQISLLRDIPPHIVKKAWFTLAHTLLDPGSRLIDAGCLDGAMAYTMAALNPEIHVIGLDINPQTIQKARSKYALPNLEFQAGDIFKDISPKDSVDVIVNSFVLHEIYSASRYNERLIGQALEQQYKALRENGSIIVRDHVMQSPDDYVLIEFNDKPSTGENIERLSEADLLIWFSEHARSQFHPDGAGFFLEELPPNYPRTRLFRVPAKWAHEFILRKEDRQKLKVELEKEYAFFTEQEFCKHLQSFGARIAYSAPHWDEGFVKSRYQGHCRLYREDGTPLGPPPTNHIIVAQKIGDEKSQIVLERRTSRARIGTTYLRTVRDERTGQISSIACRDLEVAEVLPFRITPEGRLKIYLHEGVPRGLANSVPRSAKNLDGRRWSGHMTEPIALDATVVRAHLEKPHANLVEFANDKIGITPSMDARLIEGPGFYPDPHRIDERIVTYYLRTENYHPPFDAHEVLDDVRGFSSLGRIREFDAQCILNSIAVGFLPSSHLEVQLLGLYKLLGLKAEVWGEMPLQLSEVPVEEVVDVNKLIAGLNTMDDRFKAVRGTAGDIRLVQSVFVDEGRVQNGGMTGLAARDMEYVVAEEGIVNTAVVMPLVKDLNGEVLAEIVTEYFPVPQRYSGTGFTLTLPSFPLPKEVTDMEAARLFVAEQFQVKPQYVARMGESYFTHIGMTPHRIYPFVVTNTRGGGTGHTHGTTQLTTLKDLGRLLYWDNHDSFMKIAAMALQYVMDSDMSVRRDFDVKLSDQSMKSKLSESSIVSYDAPSSAPAASSSAGEEDRSASSASLSAFRDPRQPR